MRKSRTLKAFEAQEEAHAESSKRCAPLVGYFNDQNNELMQPESKAIISLGEVIPEDNSIARSLIKNTLEEPDTPAVDASLERTQLLQEAGALEIGVDAAASIQARNSLEKMLAHQLAVCHMNSMKLMIEAMGAIPTNSHAEHLVIKKMNLAARLMDTYQRGFEAIGRIRNAGQQTITVKQIRINGGQNVIADTIPGRGGGRGDE